MPQVGLRQRQVLGHLVAHRRVGPDGLVRGTWREDELPVGDHVALAPRAIHPEWVIAQAEQHPDLRHDQPLPERHAALMG